MNGVKRQKSGVLENKRANRQTGVDGGGKAGSKGDRGDQAQQEQAGGSVGPQEEVTEGKNKEK